MEEVRPTPPPASEQSLLTCSSACVAVGPAPPQFGVEVRARLIPITRPLHSQQLAGRALARPELDRDERYLFSQTGKLQPLN